MESEKIQDLTIQRNLAREINLALKQKNLELNFHLAEIQKSFSNSNNAKLAKNIPVMAITLALAASAALLFLPSQGQSASDENLKTRYLIENLRGDTIDTWKYWKIAPQEKIYVNIVGSSMISEEHLDAIRNAILSEDVVNIADQQAAGGQSVYYLGWMRALKHMEGKTQNPVPTQIEIIQSQEQVGDIIIVFRSAVDADGYSGFTKTIVDGEQILKSTITIFDINNVTPEKLSVIARHEFGHALGLAHSSDPEDLMAPQIVSATPYISLCNIEALMHLYNGNPQSKVTCK